MLSRAVEYTDCTSAVKNHPANESDVYDTKQTDARALRNAEHPSTAITLRSTLARSGSTW